MPSISEIRRTLKKIRVDAVNELVSIMKKHDRKEVTSNNIFIDNLIEILDWVISYENFIFESEG